MSETTSTQRSIEERLDRLSIDTIRRSLIIWEDTLREFGEEPSCVEFAAKRIAELAAKDSMRPYRGHWETELEGYSALAAEVRKAWAERDRPIGSCRVWPTLWAGGTDSRRVDGHNTIWVESDELGVICYMVPENGRVTQETYRRAQVIVDAFNQTEKP